MKPAGVYRYSQDNYIRYPFHLRPRNKQPFRYLCMATEVIHDLGLDREAQTGLHSPGEPVTTTQQLDRIRAYLGCFYLVSTLVARLVLPSCPRDTNPFFDAT